MSDPQLLRLRRSLEEVDATLAAAGPGEFAGVVDDYLGSASATDVAIGGGALLEELQVGQILLERELNLHGVLETWNDDETVQAWKRRIASCQVGVTAALGIAAETGTLLLAPSDPDERMVSLLPERHLAIVRRADVVESIGELMARWSSAGDPEGSAVFVTGPSRTADIEKELVLGVHGPLAVHVIVVDA